MTIAAVPMGAAVLDVPRRGDVLVIKERVGNLTTPAVPWQRPGVSDFAARAALKCITPGRARVRRPNGSQARLCLAAKPSWASSGLAWLGVFRLADYQIVEADKLRERADARRLLAQTLYAKRGTIYDRNGNVLASSVECRNIAVNPQLVEDVDKTVSALVKATGIDKKTCRKLVESDGTWVYIKRQVDEDDVAALEKKNLPGVLFEQAMKRVYPYGNLASQVLGVVNVDNDGLTGLEKQYNKLLTGTNGSLVRERARDGSYIAGGAYKKVAAVDGVDIVTTLDVNIQRAAEDALAEAVEKTKAKNGSALVTDPTTGEILAACSYPTYDQTDLENAKTEDMNLRLVTDAYEPGLGL